MIKPVRRSSQYGVQAESRVCEGSMCLCLASCPGLAASRTEDARLCPYEPWKMSFGSVRRSSAAKASYDRRHPKRHPKHSTKEFKYKSKTVSRRDRVSNAFSSLAPSSVPIIPAKASRTDRAVRSGPDGAAVRTCFLPAFCPACIRLSTSSNDRMWLRRDRDQILHTKA